MVCGTKKVKGYKQGTPGTQMKGYKSGTPGTSKGYSKGTSSSKLMGKRKKA